MKEPTALTWADVQKAQKHLRENYVSSEMYVILNPMIYNGYWYVSRVIPLFRWLGRKLRSRRIYWLGFQLQWVDGMKDWQ